MAQIGKVALFEGKDILFHGMNLLLIRSDSKQCLPHYLYRLLNGVAGKRQTLRYAKKAINQASINVCDVKKMVFTIPGPAEQQQIVDVLMAADQHVVLLQKKRIALSKQKKALMQQLLNGWLRVK